MRVGWSLPGEKKEAEAEGGGRRGLLPKGDRRGAVPAAVAPSVTVDPCLPPREEALREEDESSPSSA